MVAWLKSLPQKLSTIDGDRLATLSMRWARPIAFIGFTILLIAAFWLPDEVGAYFDAMAKAPDWLSNILTILVLGLAVEKGLARPLKEVVEAIKKK